MSVNSDYLNYMVNGGDAEDLPEPTSVNGNLLKALAGKLDEIKNRHSVNAVHEIGKWGNDTAYEACLELATTWSGTNNFNLTNLITGFTGASKVIDYSVICETNTGKFIKASMVGSGIDLSAYLSDDKTLAMYSSETITRLIFHIEFTK